MMITCMKNIINHCDEYTEPFIFIISGLDLQNTLNITLNVFLIKLNNINHMRY